MMKSEFENLIQQSVNDEDYGTIEYVYTWHPAIGEATGKNQIADLYMHYGMTVIEDMVERAGKMEQADRELQEAQRQVAVVQDRIEALKGRKTETPGAATPRESR